MDEMTVMPNTGNIRLWVDALRSGEYKQGTGTLHDPGDNTFCCLGVACDVARKNGVQMEIADDAGGFTKYDGNDGFMPPSVVAWLGTPDGNPQLGTYTATELNDGHRESFDAIADRIAAEYLGFSEMQQPLVTRMDPV